MGKSLLQSQFIHHMEPTAGPEMTRLHSLLIHRGETSLQTRSSTCEASCVHLHMHTKLFDVNAGAAEINENINQRIQPWRQAPAVTPSGCVLTLAACTSSGLWHLSKRGAEVEGESQLPPVLFNKTGSWRSKMFHFFFAVTMTFK